MTVSTEVPRVSRGQAEHGHLEEFRTDPIGLMQRVRDGAADRRRSQRVLLPLLRRRTRPKRHSATIEREVPTMIAGWGDEGEIDPLEFFAELTIYTSTACLIGKRFREELDGRIADPEDDMRRRDMIDVMVSIPDQNGNPRFSADEITGIIISIMFAGHRTSSGTTAWTLIETLRNTGTMSAVVNELDQLHADGAR